jgi:hypothetical protein
MKRMMAWPRKGLRKLASLPSSMSVRYLLVFGAGIAAALAWQSWAVPVRATVAGWSPRLAWLAPGALSRGATADRVKATSLALAAVRQSVDKLATEVGRLEAQAAEAAPAPAAPPPASSKRSRR